MWVGVVCTKTERHDSPYTAGGVFVDVGAFIGWFSLLSAAHGCHAHAFEPQSRAVDLFAKSLATNGFEPLVTVHHSLVWDTREGLELGLGTDNWGTRPCVADNSHGAHVHLWLPCRRHARSWRRASRGAIHDAGADRRFSAAAAGG